MSRARSRRSQCSRSLMRTARRSSCSRNALNVSLTSGPGRASGHEVGVVAELLPFTSQPSAPRFGETAVGLLTDLIPLIDAQRVLSPSVVRWSRMDRRR